MPLDQLSELVSFVAQDNYLFDATIRENIRLGRPQATDEEVAEAARAACCDEFVSKLPQGYDTQAGAAGGALSGGERQRVGIARVMLADPDVVVMDEPTSSLDILHEKELLKTLEKEYSHKTLLIISHRMSTLTGCTRIIHLEHGKGTGGTGKENMFD